MWSDNETAIDLLGFQHLANAVVSVIRKDNLLPATIGVYGDWGSGKSSLIQIIQKELEQEDGVVVLNFNGWLFEGYEDAKTALMGSIIEELLDQKRILPELRDKAKKMLKRIDGFKLAGGVAKMAVGLATGGLPIAFSGSFDLISTAKSVYEGAKDVKPEDLKGIIKEEDKKAKEEEDNLRRSIRKFRKDFGDLLKDSKITKLVVIIDDLDRCLPDTIIETLEAIKLFLFVDNTAFILGADERLVKYAVRKRFPELPGERVEVGRDYLEKLVQFPIRVPPLGRGEMETYISLLFTQISQLSPEQQEQARQATLRNSAGSLTSVNFNLSIAETLFGDQLPQALKEQLGLAGRVAPLLSTGLKGSPRQCKRFLNTLLIRLEMAEFREVPLQQRVLAKLMLLEYFRPETFRRLAELQAEQEGKPKQLALLEQEVIGTTNGEKAAKKEETDTLTEPIAEEAPGTKAKQNKDSGKEQSNPAPVADVPKLEGEFKSWLSQNWMHEWLKLEPALANIDLRPYFYFSRDALISPLSGESQRMSPHAQEIFTGLTNESSAVQNNALKRAADLSVADAAAVFEALSQRAQQEEEFDGDNQPLKRLFEWAESRRELRGELVTMLRRLPENSVSSVLIPRLLGLCQGHETEEAAYELLQKWSESSNKSLANIAKSRLNQREGGK